MMLVTSIPNWVVIIVVQLCLVGCSADYFWDGDEWKWQVKHQLSKLESLCSYITNDKQFNVVILIWTPSVNHFIHTNFGGNCPY